MKKFKKLKIIIKCISCFILAMIFSSCTNNTKSSSNKLKVGMECSYAPFNWIQPTSKGEAIKISGGWFANGYDVYISKKISEILGMDLEIVKLDWDGLLPALTSGKIDAIVAGMSVTEERKKAIDFTNDYYTSNIVIVVKKGSKYESAECLDDFKHAKITGQIGTIHYDFIDQIEEVDKQTPMEDFPSMVSSLSAGKIDGYVSERSSALMATYSNPLLTYIDFKPGSGFKFSKDEVSIAIGVRKNSELKDKINKALESISEETKGELMNKAVERSYVS